MLLHELNNYVSEAVKRFDVIPEERKVILNKISQYVQYNLGKHNTSELIYVCTHNSRRSHFGQVWGKVASAYYDVPNVNTYSAGTEATAFNPNAIKALKQAGFKVLSSDGSAKNPTYTVRFSDTENPVLCFSKTYEDASIPNENLCAVMTCTEADGNCPFIPGTAVRISCPYDDPKAYDGTAQQEEKYAERCLQIATECLYVFSLVKR